MQCMEDAGVVARGGARRRVTSATSVTARHNRGQIRLHLQPRTVTPQPAYQILDCAQTAAVGLNLFSSGTDGSACVALSGKTPHFSVQFSIRGFERTMLGLVGWYVLHLQLRAGRSGVNAVKCPYYTCDT